MLERGSSKTAVKVRRTSVRRILSTAVFVFMLLVLAAPPTAFVHAQSPVTNGLSAVGNAAGIASGSTDLPTIIGRIINIFLGFVGIILLVLLLYAGYLWMTSGGDPTKVDQAKNYIRNALIGLVIIVSAFAITSFVISQLIGATGGGGGTAGSGAFGAGSGFPSSASSLGGGIIEYHFPPRDATNIPRNTSIIITFKEPIKIASFVKGYNDNGTPADLSDDTTSSTTLGLNDDAVKIYPTGQRDTALPTTGAVARFTADRQSFVIRPVDFLGNPTTDTNYTVELLPGTSGILREDGQPAFSGSLSSGYIWQFQVSTLVDNTPPRMTSVIPADGGSFAPNVIVQMNFNEPIDPTSAAGVVGSGGTGFSNIEIAADPLAGGATVRPSGEYKISNQYKTIEFVSDLSCGTNSCGRTVYCLPSESSVSVIAHAATLSDTPPLAFFTSSGYDGITDIAGNSLDGNGNSTAEGRGADDYGWTFATQMDPNLDAPRIRSTLPLSGASNIPVDQAPQAVYDSVLQSSTVNSDNVYISTNEPASSADTFWWSVRQEVLTPDGTVAAPGDPTTQERVSINHRLYVPADDAGGGTPIYQPTMLSGIQNIYQNCFNPASSDSCAGSPNCCDEHSQTAACAAPTPLP